MSNSKVGMMRRSVGLTGPKRGKKGAKMNKSRKILDGTMGNDYDVLLDDEDLVFIGNQKQ